ncbi:DUF1752-domain-containing protein [Moniliophthora roreri MCA 2997]|uniref:DUF1752-domain-containing protein n=1 Tax=Moniliophthora roreri (strain MCA 2997) TaxID=1381753 RepID=V2WXA4_MONRO|nr:DUF1752-domain-containing protein [Moniliophthora roreri MCA 2997]
MPHQGKRDGAASDRGHGRAVKCCNSKVAVNLSARIPHAMLLDFPSPILTVSPDALKHLDGDGAIKSLWYLFTKCKGSLHDGPRLENISWRLWYQEMAATGSYRPLTPNSPSSEVTDRPFVLSQGEYLVVISLENSR